MCCSWRSAATAATLLVCVLVGSVLFVGLFSFESSFQSIVNQGSPTDIRRQRDVWTFARTMGTGDPNWLLVATGE